MIERYATRVSIYSLVGLDVLRFENINPDAADQANGSLGWVVRDDTHFYSCIGDIRRSYGGYFFDVTALTLSIVALENYNRQFLRQAAEIHLQDVMSALGIRADYSIGPAQVKTSLASETYRAHVKKTATDQEIKTFARSSCGSTYIASLLIESYLDECSKALPSANFDEIAKCVVNKYTGLKEGGRLFEIYTRSVILSYTRLFDSSSEFFDRQFAAKLGIPQMYSGECIEFNPRRGQLRISPGASKNDGPDDPGSDAQKQKPQRVIHRRGREHPLPPSPKNDSPGATSDPTGDVGKKDQGTEGEEDIMLVIDPDTILKFKRPGQKVAIVKIIPSAERSAHASERESLISKYACGRYQPTNVDFYPAFSFLPDRIREFCKDDNEEMKPDSYIALILATGKSGEGGGRSESCPAANKPPPPAGAKAPTKSKR